MNTAVLKEKLEKLDKRFSADAIGEKRQLKALGLDLSEESHYEWKYLKAIPMHMFQALP